MFNNGLQILQPTCEKWQYSIVSYFFVLTTVAGFIQNVFAHAQKETCKGKVLLGMWLEIFEFQWSNINVRQKLV